MASIKLIYSTLESLCNIDGDKTAILDKLKKAVEILGDAIEDMDSLSVKGRESVDILAGCYICLGKIIGEDEE